MLTLTCLGLHYNSMAEHSDQHTVMLINGTFVGFSIILVGLFAGYLMNTPINKRIGKTCRNIIIELNLMKFPLICRSLLLIDWMRLVHHQRCFDFAILERFQCRKTCRFRLERSKKYRHYEGITVHCQRSNLSRRCCLHI